LQKIAHVKVEQKRRNNISKGFESLKKIVGLCDSNKISKERILNEGNSILIF
jgi:hypothetical protein